MSTTIRTGKDKLCKWHTKTDMGSMAQVLWAHCNTIFGKIAPRKHGWGNGHWQIINPIKDMWSMYPGKTSLLELSTGGQTLITGTRGENYVRCLGASTNYINWRMEIFYFILRWQHPICYFYVTRPKLVITSSNMWHKSNDNLGKSQNTCDLIMARN